MKLLITGASGDLECSVLTNVSRYMVNKYTIEEMVKL